jgi:ribosome maturation factor RimP
MVVKNIEKDITKKIIEYLKPFLNENNLILFDISFGREKTGRVLRITIDKDDINVDHCTLVSRFISKKLDEEDIIPYEKYTLEVSTPGLERPLKTIEDFKRFINKNCKIILKEKEEDGRKKYTGIIEEINNNIIKIFVEKENKRFEINFKNIKKANLEVKF